MMFNGNGGMYSFPLISVTYFRQEAFGPFQKQTSSEYCCKPARELQILLR